MLGGKRADRAQALAQSVVANKRFAAVLENAVLTNHVGNPKLRRDFHKLYLTQRKQRLGSALRPLSVRLLGLGIVLSQRQDEAPAPLSEVITNMGDDARTIAYWKRRVARAVK